LQDATDPLLDSAAALLYHAAKASVDAAGACAVRACEPFVDMVISLAALSEITSCLFMVAVLVFVSVMI
jgi:hypothetical protein